jgi:hypothetical protein
MSVMRPIVWYRFVYVACIAYMGVETVRGAHGVADHHFWIGATETAAVLLLLYRPLRSAAFTALLAIYALVAGISIASGHVPAHLILYAASALLIVQLDRAAT